ncbi:response regulator [Actinoallomurus oryzae]|uniref:Response regulator n=1 Tax=Actinoallomurus oryzae TaxID=502180 RepID=A0ABP8QQH8_9ACTN
MISYAAPNTARLRALLVDDNDHFLRAAGDHLERDGIDVVGVATTPAEALRRTRDAGPDVALVDVMLGTEFGFDLVDALTQAVPKPPRVIMMSTHATTDLAEMVAASPAIGFLPKARLSALTIRALVTQAA